MITRLKVLLSILLASSGLILAPALSVSADYNPLQPACDSIPAGSSSAVCNQAAQQSTNKDNPISGSNGIIKKATNVVAIVAALGAVVNIFIGAFEFVTAGGTGFKSATANPAPTKAAKARSRVTSGFIGLMIVALAWAIVRFVEDRVIR